MKEIAILFEIVGFWGLGYSLIKEKKKYIHHLEIQNEIFYLIQGEITHFYKPFPDICRTIAIMVPQPYQKFLENVGNGLLAWDGTTLESIWKNAIDDLAKNGQVPKKMLVHLEKLVDNLHYENCEMQAQAIAFAKEKLVLEIQQKKQEIQQNQKCILWLCAMSGLLCVIIFI